MHSIECIEWDWPNGSKSINANNAIVLGHPVVMNGDQDPSGLDVKLTDWFDFLSKEEEIKWPEFYTFDQISILNGRGKMMIHNMSKSNFKAAVIFGDLSVVLYLDRIIRCRIISHVYQGKTLTKEPQKIFRRQKNSKLQLSW